MSIFMMTAILLNCRVDKSLSYRTYSIEAINTQLVKNKSREKIEMNLVFKRKGRDKKEEKTFGRVVLQNINYKTDNTLIGYTIDRKVDSVHFVWSQVNQGHNLYGSDYYVKFKEIFNSSFLIVENLNSLMLVNNKYKLKLNGKGQEYKYRK